MSGEWDVGKIEQGMTAKRFMEWENYAVLEPFNELRDDYRTASIVQMIANVNRGSKDAPYKLEDFLLKFGEPEKKPRKQSWEEQLAFAKIIAMAQNAGAVEH